MFMFMHLHWFLYCVGILISFCFYYFHVISSFPPKMFIFNLTKAYKSCNLNECPLRDSAFWLCCWVYVLFSFLSLFECICFSSFERNFNFICQTKCWITLRTHIHIYTLAQHTLNTYYSCNSDEIFIPGLCAREFYASWRKNGLKNASASKIFSTKQFAFTFH